MLQRRSSRTGFSRRLYKQASPGGCVYHAQASADCGGLVAHGPFEQLNCHKAFGTKSLHIPMLWGSIYPRFPSIACNISLSPEDKSSSCAGLLAQPLKSCKHRCNAHIDARVAGSLPSGDPVDKVHGIGCFMAKDPLIALRHVFIFDFQLVPTFLFNHARPTKPDNQFRLVIPNCQQHFQAVVNCVSVLCF